MASTLFISSNKTIFDAIASTFKLSQLAQDFYTGDSFDLLLVTDNKIECAIKLTHLIDSKAVFYKRIVVVNPINCPNIDVELGKIVFAESITEWDKPLVESKFYNLTVPEFDTKIISGYGMSGDRVCMNRTTPILQARFIDFITFSIAVVSNTFLKDVELMSMGVVADHCTQNYFKLLQSNDKGLSSRMIEFIQTNLSLLLGE